MNGSIWLHSEILKELLLEFQAVANSLELDFYIIGATARDAHYAKHNSESGRRTKDVDIAIQVGNETLYQQLIESLCKDAAFTQIDYNPIKLFYRKQIEVDIIPFGGIRGSDGYVHLQQPVSITLHMAGIDEAFAFAQLTDWQEPRLKICSIEGLIMLKLISWDDNPGRTKDIKDIDDLIVHYFDWFNDDMYENYYDLFDNYDVNDASHYLNFIAAQAIGLKIREILHPQPNLIERVTRILAKSNKKAWSSMHMGLLGKRSL